MDTSEILKEVRKIEIKARILSSQIFAGQYHSAFKGKGMAFSEVREYQFGDDIRNVDWNVTARFNHPYIKVFEEERELTVTLLIDVSGSQNFGSFAEWKRILSAKIAAVLAFSAIQNNDKIGMIFFSDKIEKFIPPKKGKTHTLRLIRELISFESTSKGTSISEALRYFTNAIKKRCVAFLISDFMDSNFEQALKIAGHKHDLVALRLFDERETVLPPIGLVQVLDAETGKTLWLDTSNSDTRLIYQKQWRMFNEKLDTTFRKSGVDFAVFKTGQDFVKPLIELFKHR